MLQEEPTWFLRGKQPVRAGPGSSAELQYQVTFLCLGNGVRELLEFGNEEPIHVVCVGIETPCMLEGGVETPVLEPGGGKVMRNDRMPLVNPGQLVNWHAPGETFLAKVQSCGHQTDIAFLQGIIHHPLVFLHLPEIKR